MPKTIALVVPSITNTGGVAAVAEFVMRTILDRSAYSLRLISLAMAARDSTSVRLTSPPSWLRGVTTRQGDFRGTEYTHVGARFSEIETQRYQPRAALAQVLDGADLIQVVCGTPSWARPVLGLGIPVCLQVATLIEVERVARSANWTGPTGAWRRHMTRRNAAMETPVLRQVDTVQVENDWMATHVRKVTEGAGTDIMMGVPGVDDALFHPPDTAPQAPGYILSVGRMSDPRKNHSLLLETYRRVCARLDAAPRLALAGPDGPTEAFVARARELDLWDRIDVHVFPDKAALAALYRGARAFVLTSDEEGFGVTVAEAMASGTPAVSTRSGGPDGIIAHGEDGFLADRDDANGLSDALVTLLSDPDLEARMRRAARAKVDAQYGNVAAGAAFLDCWRRVLGS